MKFIEERRSVYPRMFSKERVTVEEVKKILEVSKWAPTHKLTQPWHFHVFMESGKGQLEKILVQWLDEQEVTPEVRQKKLEKMQFNIEASGAVVAIILQRDKEKRIPYFEELASVACAVQNFWLCLKPMGLAGYWSTGSGTNSPVVRKALKLEPEDEHIGWFYLGKTEVELPLPVNRKSVDEYVSWTV